MKLQCLSWLLIVLLGGWVFSSEKDLAALLETLEKSPLKEKPDYGADVRRRRDEFNKKDLEKWKAIATLEDWEKHRKDVLAGLRKHIVPDFTPQKKVKHVVTGTLPGEGFIIENVVYETIPGLVVTANLYRPDPAVKNPPAILIIHSHHNPKTQGELQDMGMTWARCGCLVLVPDMLGHGERRQHPFKDGKSFPEAFKAGRQDYYFRYNLGVQLSLIGESLCGWMARDMMRGVDLVLEYGADPKRIILMGSVAGGGDPAGVTAAADERIACVVPFNFGGPQPETKFPLPEDAETWFNYHGGGSWESTRGLAFSASGGFPHWAIVASVAPRKLIHAHEFAWDQKRDPVWKRYQKIWGWHKADDGVGFAHGAGKVTGSSPEDTHCNNIGAAHRKMIYPYLKKWFDIPIPEKEYVKRVPAEKLTCLTEEAVKTLRSRTVVELLQEKAKELMQAEWAKLNAIDPRQTARLRERIRASLQKALPQVEPWAKTTWESMNVSAGEVVGQRSLVKDENGLTIASVLLLTKKGEGKRRPLVAAVAQQGAQGFLKHRAETISLLLDKGVAVALIDVRGAGELAPVGAGRGRTGGSTGLSATEWMLGHSLVEHRLRDLRTVLQHLRDSRNVDGKRIALWGDSFAPVNDAKAVVDVPHDAAKQPHLAEPLGSVLVRLAGVWENDVQAVYCRGGLVGYWEICDNHFVHVPHDVLVPGILRTGDLFAADMAIAPRPLKMEGLRDSRNRESEWLGGSGAHPARGIYLGHEALEGLSLRSKASSEREIAEWVLSWLHK